MMGDVGKLADACEVGAQQIDQTRGTGKGQYIGCLIAPRLREAAALLRSQAQEIARLREEVERLEKRIRLYREELGYAPSTIEQSTRRVSIYEAAAQTGKQKFVPPGDKKGEQ